MKNMPKKLPTEHASFRINKKILESLKEVSREEHLSLNTYVNRILDSHLNWDLFAPEVGWVVMLKSVSKEIIKNLDNEKISQIAKNAAESGSKEIALSMRGKYNVIEWISILKNRAKSSGFTLKEYQERDTIRLVMYHDMGEKWSLFFETYYNTVFFEMGANIQSEYTENSILLEIKSKILE
ncbi:MAG: hypothetical protein K5790_01435 [Nitrosopumilus sp.]|uniref:hypothetical protein n=1 Tax=Nitrosopumilus sp. TaxID=2024843 RepID=UPI00247EA2AE|nr:hypothetical protein [Nitrosopumilus sp.]MCV0391936.1 hypothetical protein [Nitrosopumilus sp.]